MCYIFAGRMPRSEDGYTSADESAGGERARIGDENDEAVNSSVVDRSGLDAGAGSDDSDGLDARGDQATATHEERDRIRRSNWNDPGCDEPIVATAGPV